MRQKLPQHVIDEIDAIMAHPGGPVGPTMPFVMQKWRWVRTGGDGWETCDEWRPPT